ncbi:MAG TPA: 7TM diverse intracellular signaling domain-containing protein [Rectinemataceae bacterium]|nr:7TM diverse intracellular signaling domain-containing protein [Rectinemataceae bacterium]
MYRTAAIAGARRARCRSRVTAPMFVMVLALAGFGLGAQSPVEVSALKGSLDLTPRLEIMRDPSAALTIDEVQSAGAGFHPPAADKVNFGYTPDALWARFSLRNDSAQPVRVFLEYAYPPIQNATFYSPEDGGPWQSKTLGDTVPFSRREVRNRSPVFPILLPAGAERSYYLRAVTTGSLEMPLVLWEPGAFYESDHARQMLYGLLFGLMLIMGFSNLSIFVFTRDFTYIAYLVFIVGMSYFVATIRGLSFEYLFPEAPFMANISMPLSIGFADFGGALFTISFLDSKRTLPGWNLALRIFLVATALVMLLSPLVEYSRLVPVAGGLTIALAILFLLAGIAGLRRHNRAARFYTAAWIALILGVIVTALRAFGAIGISFVSEYGLEIGAATEVVLLSISLADKLSIAQKEKVEAQRRALEEHKALADSFSRFVPQEFLRFLGKQSVAEIALGDQTLRDMTILFSDIRSFTTLSESMSPEENFRFINSYLSRIGPLVRHSGGFIDKYIGDAIMALFPERPERAIESALSMQRALVVYNGHRHKSGFLPIRVGIGMHHGTLSLGTIGETNRMDTTVISDAVNIASRLENLTKRYGAQIIVSAALLGHLAESGPIASRYLDRVRVKGKRHFIDIHEILESLDDETREARKSNEEVLKRSSEQMRRRDWRAALDELGAARGGEFDPAIDVYQSRCMRMLGQET